MQPANLTPIPIPCQNIMRSLWINRLWRHRQRYYHQWHQKMDFRNKWMHFKYMHMVCTHSYSGLPYPHSILLILVQLYRMHLITVVESNRFRVLFTCIYLTISYLNKSDVNVRTNLILLTVLHFKFSNQTKTEKSMIRTDLKTLNLRLPFEKSHFVIIRINHFSAQQNARICGMRNCQSCLALLQQRTMGANSLKNGSEKNRFCHR